MTRPQPRPDVWEKRAHVQSLLRLGGGDRPSGHLVTSYAEQIGMRRETLYRWLRDKSLTDVEAKQPTLATRFEIDTSMLTVVAQEQSLRAGYERLRAAGIIDVSYPTFCRAMDRIDPAVLHGAMSGRKEMAANRIYLKRYVPHRCHMYFLDHTKLDIFVLPTHKHTTPVRPHLTVIGDAYSGYLWAFIWYRTPDGTAITAALASTCTEQVIEGVSVGGIPQQLILDNAAEHFSEDMRRAITMLGIVVAPTSAYSSWQNGKAERAIQLVNRMVTADAPGATRVGTDKSSTRFLRTVRAKTEPETLWSAASLENKLRDVLTRINSGIRRSDRGGLTRLELFHQDPTERLFLTDEAARLVSLRTDKDSYRASKHGVQFRNKHYVSADISPKRRYKVRYLPGNVNFIEVFDEADKYITRAYNQETLSKEERDLILAGRARSERDVRAVEEGVKRHRRHLAALEEAGFPNYDVRDGSPPTYAELPARDPEVSQEPKRKPPRVPVKPATQGDEEVNRRYEKVMGTTSALALIADIVNLNASSEAKEMGEPGDN